METINRTVLIVLAKQPMVDWLQQLPDWPQNSAPPITTEEINLDSAAYLIPEYDTPDETMACIQRMKLELFEEALGGWTTDKRLWPKKRTRKLFDEWFSTQFHTVVYDLDLAAPIEHDED